jgi:beta-N-acetylhexosaminidase
MLRLTDLTLEDRVGQLFWIGFDGLSIGPELQRLVRTVRPGGLILFARNLEDAPQARSLTDALFRSLPIPPFIALDQEGGRVNRLRTILGPTAPALDLASRPRAPLAVKRHA